MYKDGPRQNEHQNIKKDHIVQSQCLTRWRTRVISKLVDMMAKQGVYEASESDLQGLTPQEYPS